MAKRKRKPKRKNSEFLSFLKQLEGCAEMGLRLMASVLLLFFLALIALLVYLQTMYPGVDLTVVITMLSLFAYLSGYFAFDLESDEDEEKPKNDWFEDDEDEL